MPDARKGEQLVLVTEAKESSLSDLRERARQEGFPELGVPKSIVIVPEIPLLGTGKVDLAGTIALAQQRRSAS